MPDRTYCYPGTDVLINKLHIRNHKDLFEAEKELTYIRLKELQENPVVGAFDFAQLKAIHKYIFQDVYDWAGMERTVEIGKGNLFCTTACIQDYARVVFGKYFPQCRIAKDHFADFVEVFAGNYGDLNALHPFREGNGRAQREFARLVCMECGYVFDLSGSSHSEMLQASKLSFDKGDNSGLVRIFTIALSTEDGKQETDTGKLNILTSDDLVIGTPHDYEYYDFQDDRKLGKYSMEYQAKISKMGLYQKG